MARFCPKIAAPAPIQRGLGPFFVLAGQILDADEHERAIRVTFFALLKQIVAK